MKIIHSLAELQKEKDYRYMYFKTIHTVDGTVELQVG